MPGTGSLLPSSGYLLSSSLIGNHTSRSLEPKGSKSHLQEFCMLISQGHVWGYEVNKMVLMRCCVVRSQGSGVSG